MEELKQDKPKFFVQSEPISDNIFIQVYIEAFIKKFRSYNNDEFIITIYGIKNFISYPSYKVHIALDRIRL